MSREYQPGHVYDVAIVGAGMAGSHIAARLVKKGFDVVILDAGNELFFDPETGEDQRQSLLDRFYRSIYKTPNAPFPNLAYAPSPDNTYLNKYYVERGPLSFTSTYTRIVGGTTYHWLGLIPRLDPGTFREKTLYDRAIDWPISYEDLEDWYYAVERAIGAAGDDASQGKAGVPPRKPDHPYPLPPIPQTYSDRVAAEAVEGLIFTDPYNGERIPIQITPTPAARNSIPYDGRPPCQGSANCIPICPTRAKYDATVHLKQALGIDTDPFLDEKKLVRRGACLVMGAVLKEVELDASEGPHPEVSSLLFKRSPSGDDDLRVRARAYVLAIHAMEMPKILLASRSRWEHGVANSSGVVGRYLMDHDIAITNARLSQPLYPFRGPRITSSIEGMAEGQFRRYHSAFRPELSNTGTSWEANAPFSNVISRVNQGMTGKALRAQVGWDSVSVLHIDAMIEPDPQYESRVYPSEHKDIWGLPRPEIRYQVGEYSERGRGVFISLMKQVYARLGATEADMTVIPGWFGAGHVMGTTRMGVNPRTSACNSFGLTHDHPNLYLTGAGLFPTVGTQNPTLTLTALAWRTADAIERRLGRTATEITTPAGAAV